MKDMNWMGFGMIVLVSVFVSVSSADARPERLSAVGMRQAIDAVRAIGFDVREEVLRPTAVGGDEAMLITNDTFDGVVARLRNAFSNNDVFAGGFRILAQATHKQSGNVNFTMGRPDGDYLLVQVLNVGDSATIRIDGDITPKRR